MLDRRQELMERVFSNVLVDPSCMINGQPCLLWQGNTSGKPKPGDRNSRGHSYPRISVNGVNAPTHHVVFVHFFGYIPYNRQVDHICTNRLCVQPLHLALVSHKENQRRRDGKRPRKGTHHQVFAVDNLSAELRSVLSKFKCEGLPQ